LGFDVIGLRAFVFADDAIILNGCCVRFSIGLLQVESVCADGLVRARLRLAAKLRLSVGLRRVSDSGNSRAVAGFDAGGGAAGLF
jgi:hypothetical protein